MSAPCAPASEREMRSACVGSLAPSSGFQLSMVLSSSPIEFPW